MQIGNSINLDVAGIKYLIEGNPRTTSSKAILYQPRTLQELAVYDKIYLVERSSNFIADRLKYEKPVAKPWGKSKTCLKCGEKGHMG